MKKWQKLAEGLYELQVSGLCRGQLKFFSATTESKALINLGNEEYTIRRTGFWKNSLEITNDKLETVLKVVPEKWYGNTYRVDYHHSTFTLLIRNNPLAEWALLAADELVLAYGLDTSGEKVGIRITGNTGNTADLLPDFLLWYLFLPIATENTGNEFVFNLLLTSQ
jgi:hypothetical protein